MIGRHLYVKTLITCSALFAVVLGSPGVAAAAVNAATNFDDISGGGTALVPQLGGTGWSTNWKSDSFLVSDLPNGVLVTTAGSNREEVPTTSANGATAYRGLNVPLVDSLNNTFYIHFDGQNLNDSQRFWGISLFSGTTERMLIGEGTGFTNWTINNLLTAVTANSGIDASTQANLLVKIVFGGFGSQETLKFWVNPNYSADENDATNNAALIGTYTTLIDWGSIDRLRIGGGNTNASFGFTAHWIDNLVIEDSSPFVPEPTAATLLVLGAAGLGARRWRFARRAFRPDRTALTGRA